MKSILNPKTVAWVYVVLGIIILLVQLIRIVPNMPLNWLRYAPGFFLLIIGLLRLQRIHVNRNR
jgi:hypothetical protein